MPSRAWQAARRRLRRSMTAQIWLAVALVATLLVSGSSLLLLWLTQRELQAVGALDPALLRDLWVQGLWTIGAAVLLSALTAALLGVALANRIVVAARGFGAAAGRIGAQDLAERLDLARLPVELHDAGNAVNKMLDRLQAAFQRLREFSVDLAHDLRTPINNLLGEAQVALSRPRDEAEYRAVLESAVEDYERMARLIENLLFLARADDRPMPLQREWVDLRELCERMRDYFEPLADEAGLQVVVAAPAGAPGVPQALLWADRTLLIRALGNLMSNALRHADKGSVVTMACASGPAGARLSVSNVGAPIPAEHHQRIFERLFRVDPSRHGSHSGSGLGLAIVKSVVVRHGGRVELVSAAGVPTTFTLHFPPLTGVASPA
ncbi:heavy metal sensor histidine kinase [Pseudorhodoferax sp.]|uniref:heavy metal sensor histidine kinase n=1 Tax=Pseudorhodoferax sp. TaxID=1993553 RepID=UPI002DD678DF|nr:heavy metal sensor histidine kinase [Pseudorhodoferax sp.]